MRAANEINAKVRIEQEKLGSVTAAEQRCKSDVILYLVRSDR